MDAAATPRFWTARLSPGEAEAVWDRARPFLERGIPELDGLFDAETLRERVTGGDGWHLWILVEERKVRAAWVTTIATYPKARVLEVIAAGGDGMPSWYGVALSKTEQFARESGCDRLRAAGRAGWGRRGYRAVGTLFERMI